MNIPQPVFSCLLVGSLPGDVTWAYVPSAVRGVCGVSLGLSGRTALVVTRNLKVQMNPPALWGRWYTVAHRRKINDRPLFIFGSCLESLLRRLAHVVGACCTQDLSFWDTEQLCVRCRSGFFLGVLLLFVCLLKVFVELLSRHNFTNLPTSVLFLSALKAACIFRNRTVGWNRLRPKVPRPFSEIFQLFFFQRTQSSK